MGARGAYRAIVVENTMKYTQYTCIHPVMDNVKRGDFVRKCGSGTKMQTQYFPQSRSTYQGLQLVAPMILLVEDPAAHVRHSFSNAEGAKVPFEHVTQRCSLVFANSPA